MKPFLIQYNRRTEQATVTSFDDRAEALRVLNKREAARGQDEEVVLLFDGNEEALHNTHARYFMPASEIAKRLLANV